MSNPDELALLKQRADVLGIPYSGNIGAATLKARIDAKMNGEEAGGEDEGDAAPKVESEQEIRDRLYKEKMKLVLCRISNLNPEKNDLHGELITIQNRYLGAVSKFIPFGEAAENGYQLEQCLFDHLKSRKFQQVKVKKVNGQLVHETRMVPEYSLEVLPQLTEAELNELKLKQAAAERMGLTE